MEIEDDRQPTDDDFSAAFDGFTSSADAPVAGPEDDEDPNVNDVADEGGDAEGAEDNADTGEGVEDGDEAADSDSADDDSDASDDTGDSDDDADDDSDDADDADNELLRRLADLVKKRPDKEPEATDEPSRESPDEGAALYTDEEQATLDRYKEEWPEVYEAERLRRKGEYRDLLGYVFQEVAKALEPLTTTVDTLAERQQYADLTHSNPDYDEIRDAVVGWVDTQPAYLQTAYKEVMKSGTPEEVSDLLERFRSDTGKGKKAPAADLKKKKDAEPSETAKKAAKSMAPVSTKRSAVPQGDDPNDFDSAFKRFAGGS